MGAIFLDIKGAYDSVELDSLKNQLIKRKIPPYIATTVVKLFCNREVYIRVGQYKNWTKIYIYRLTSGFSAKPPTFQHLYR